MLDTTTIITLCLNNCQIITTIILNTVLDDGLQSICSSYICELEKSDVIVR